MKMDLSVNINEDALSRPLIGELMMHNIVNGKSQILEHLLLTSE